jgi:hypothetical protein
MRMFSAPILYSADNLPAAETDIFFFKPSAARPIRLQSFRLFANVTISDIFAQLQWVRRSTDGSGGTTTVLRAIDPRASDAPTTTFVSMRTTPGTLVAVSEFDPILWQMNYPLEVVYTPGEEPEAVGGVNLCLRLVNTPSIVAARSVMGFARLWE